MLYIIGLSILVLTLFIFVIKSCINKNFLKKVFNNGSVIVYGKKGSGKDILFNYIINTRKEYNATMPYKQKGYNHTEISQLSCDMTYEDFIIGNYKKHLESFKDNVDTFLTDVGVFLPSQYDSYLHKKYPSFPVFYALSRQLYNMNIHANAQALDRIWKPLREQADYYIKTLKTIKIPFAFITYYRFYDMYSSALSDVRVLKRGIIFKSEVGSVHQANTGEIKEGFIIQLKRSVKYDTRYFRKLLVISQEELKRQVSNLA